VSAKQTTAITAVNHGWRRALPYALPLLYVALACYALGARSLWGDEAYSVWASKQTFEKMFGGIDTQPPFSYALLTVTRLLWGQSEFALRYSSVFFGALTVALMGRLAAELKLSRLSIGLFFALSPIFIYFGQEARMYTLACAQCAATMLLTVQLWQGKGSRAHWFALTLISLSALYTHYYTVAILAINAVVLLWSIARKRLSHLKLSHWIISHAVIAVGFGWWFFLIQVPVLGRTAGGRSSFLPEAASAWRYLQEGIAGLVFGMRAEPIFATSALVIVLIWLASVFIKRDRASQHGWSKILIIGWFLAALAIALATASLVPAFNPRYFLFALLPLGLAWGYGVEALGSKSQRKPLPQKLISFTLLITFLACALYGNRTVFDPTWTKSSYAALLQTLRAQQQPSDVALLINSDQYGLYDYYGPAPIKTWLVSNDAQQASEAEFERFVQGHTRVWVLNFGNATLQPSRFEEKLRQRGVRVLKQDGEDAALALYQINPSGEGAPFMPMQAQFGPAIRLTAARIQPPIANVGGALAVDLVWRAIEVPAADYTVFVHLRRSDDGQQIAANDSPPANGAAPTSKWQPGQVLTDTHGVPVPPQTPPGQYRIVIGLYQYPSFERLPVQGPEGSPPNTTEWVIGEVQVQIQ